MARGLEEIQRAEDVSGGVRDGIGDAQTHVHLRREHEHRIETPFANEERGFRTADVEVLKERGRRDVRAATPGKVVDDHHVVIRGEQRLGDV
jgi:hypothetical protein